MKGLMIKDFYNITKYFKTIGIFLAVYTILSILSNNISFLGGVVTLLFAILPISTFGYDEQSNWDRYAMTFPVSKKAVAMSKYLLSLFVCLCGFFTTLLLSIMISLITKESVFMAVGVSYLLFCFALFATSGSLPLLFKYGAEKGRIILIGFMTLPALILYFISVTVKFQIPTSRELIFLCVALSPVILLAMLYISYVISCKILNNKEF